MKYRIEKIDFDPSDEVLLRQWRRLLEDSSSSEKIYQTPEFFDFLLSQSHTRQQVILLAVYDTENEEIQGIFPLRRIAQKFEFFPNTKLSFSPSVKTVLLLGSIPLMPVAAGLLSIVIPEIFALLPDIEAIGMTALPVESSVESFLCGLAASNGYLLHVLNGWRNSHLIPLPQSFDAYLSRYSAKKRFNLKRQVRLLREHSDNTLQLHRICTPDQVELYVNTWNQLAPPDLTWYLLSTSALHMLADKGLLHGYVLTLKGSPCGGIYATQAAGTLHIHNIIYANELARFSVGACILYMAIEDLIGQGQFKVIDLGYSNPAHSEQASNVVEVRGNRLVLRKTWRNRILCLAHDFYLAKLPAMKAVVKKIRGKR